MGEPSTSNPHGGLIRCAAPFVPRSVCLCHYLESLLEGGMFDLAQEEMQAEIDRGVSEVGVDDEDSGVPLAACVAIVLKVARDNADSAASVQDVAWEQVTKPR